MTCFPYDDLFTWRGQYPPEILAEQFDKMAAGWAAGLEHFERALKVVDADKQPIATVELGLARAAHTYWASVANQVRFIMARDKLASSSTPEVRAQLLGIVDAEIPLARQLFALAKQDSRIGFEAANQYFFVPLDLVEKVVTCEYLKDRYASP
jgi:hypothetical protein